MECAAADRFGVRALSLVCARASGRSLPAISRITSRIFTGTTCLPTGMWQWWAIFAPDPVRDTFVLDAEIVDAKGMRHIHEFPRLADLPWWQKVPRYRQPKFTGNMALSEYAGSQEVRRPLRGAADGSRSRRHSRSG